MNWTSYLFSFRGRASRAQYWLMVVLTIPVALVAGAINGSPRDFNAYPGGLVFLPWVWPTFAVTVRRWHDRDKSGWWLLINFVPVVGEIWSFIENGLLRGTPGANRFGPDPLAPAA